MSSSNKSAELFQTIGTILALVISSLALFVSIYEANLMRAQQKAMVWPYLKVNAGYSGRGFSFEATNNGTGPALIQSFEILYEGTPVEDYDELLDRIKPSRVIGYDRITMSTFNETVMKAGEKRILFNMPWDEETREMVKSMNKVVVRVNYCSVLEDCWIYDTQTGKHTKGTFKAAVEFRN